MALATTEPAVALRRSWAKARPWQTNAVLVLLGVGMGKNARDKRQDIKKADADRELDRALRQRRD